MSRSEWRRLAELEKCARAEAAGHLPDLVATFAELDTELAALTDGDADIYDLIRRLRAVGAPIDAERLRDEARALTGAKTIDSLTFDPAQSRDSNLTK